MSLQFILGSGLVGYALGSLIKEEQRQASLGAETLRPGEVVKNAEAYRQEVAKAKREALRKAGEAQIDNRLTAAQKNAARKNAFEEFMNTLKNVYRRLKGSPKMYGAHLDNLCVVLANLASAKKAAEDAPSSSTTKKLANMEGVFRSFAQGLVMPEDLADLLKRCYKSEIPPFSVDHLEKFLPNPATLEYAAVPTPATRPFAAVPLRAPVATPSVRRVPVATPAPMARPLTLPQVPLALPLMPEGEPVATPPSYAQEGGMEDWMWGLALRTPTPTPRGGGYAAPPASSTQAPSGPVPFEQRKWEVTGRLGVRLGPVPLRRLP